MISNKNIGLLFLLLLTAFITPYYSQVGVNILSPNTTAAMQIESPAGTSKGMLTPSMTTTQRASIKTGTIIPADGLLVYDINHHMHYSYNASTNSWNSLSPLTLTTSAISTTNFPHGVITTPSSSATFSMGINKQNPKEALDVVGNATVSGNVSVGGTLNVNATTNLNGSVSIAGFPVNAFVPVGIITMFSGTLIPSGWAICDGGTYNGLVTPDLRGRFIVGMDNTQGSQNGSGQYIAVASSGHTPTNSPNDGTTLNYGAIGNKGGETGHLLILPEMPSHKHDVSVALSHYNFMAFGLATNIDVGDGAIASGQGLIISATTTENVKGSDQIHENRPPYYVLVYIIKLP